MTRQPKRRAARKARVWTRKVVLFPSGHLDPYLYSSFLIAATGGEVIPVRITEIQPRPRAGKRGG